MVLGRKSKSPSGAIRGEPVLTQTIVEMVAKALEHQQGGDLSQAEQVYHQILQTDPVQVDALHGLGGIAYQQGQYDQAITWLRQAVAAQESNAVLQSNLGAAYRAADRLAEAEACYRQALRLKPDFAEASNNLGNILKVRGKVVEAADLYRLAILARPNYPEAHHNLGLALKELGDRSAAVVQFQEAIRLQPAFAEAHQALGLVQFEDDQLEEAVGHFQQALKVEPQWHEAHFYLGQTLQRLGRSDQALAHLGMALRLKMTQAAATAPLSPGTRVESPQPELPASPVGLPPSSTPADPHLKLGLGLRNQGKLDEAAAAFRQALQQQPDSAEAHAQLGLTLKMQRQLQEAIHHCREALRLDPDCPEAHHTLGLALRAQGRLAEAVVAFHHALRTRPDFAEAYLHLGATLREQGHLERAILYLQHALRLHSDPAEVHIQLGLALTDQGKLEEAAAAHREVLRLRPDSIAALSHLGILLEELSQPEQGRALLERAIQLGPADYQVHVHYGMSLANQGRVAEAREHFLQALAIQPNCSAAHFFLARDGQQPFTKEEVERIQDLLQQESLSLRDRINFHFTLARVYDRARAFAEAFYHCARGNACKRELLGLQGNTFDSEAHARYIDRLIAFFSAGYFQRVQSFGSDSDLPVFIVGMPRSGTSLVEQILASHPAVFGAGELRNLKQFVEGLPAELSTPGEYPECLAHLDRAAADHQAQRYLQELCRLGGEKRRVTDKMPMNFHHLGLLATLFPQAQIIHCRREPGDVCWSCYFQNFREVHFACDLKVLGTYYQQYERLMAHWQEVLPARVFEVCYEDLVDDPGRVSREMLAFCGLSWDEACLRFYETRRVVRTASNLQVRQPVYRKSVGYWKNYEPYLGSLLEALGRS
jgi:tetratricopeptide (TPR) repeat protein